MKDIASNNITVKLNNSIYNGDNKCDYIEIACKLVRKQRLKRDGIILAQFLFFVLLGFIFRNYVGLLGFAIGILVILDAFFTLAFFVSNRKGYGVTNMRDSGEIERFVDYNYSHKELRNVPTTIKLMDKNVKINSLIRLNGKYELEVTYNLCGKELIEYLPIYCDDNKVEEVSGQDVYIDLNENQIQLGKDYKVKQVTM